MILADYGADFRALSSRHEALIKRAADLLGAYHRGEAQHPTYAVIGTFGAGKTQFLYHLARQAIERGLVPLLFLAEDVFSEVIRTDTVYWSEHDRAHLVALAHQLPLERFLKICADENRQRLLESLWRSVRSQFSFGDRARPLDECVRWLESEILPVLESATGLETKAKDSLGVTGIDFEDEESFVKAAGAFKLLRDMMKTCLDSAEGAAAQTEKALLELFASSLDVAKSVRLLQTRCESARRDLERVDRTADALLRNVWEYPKAVSLLETSEDEIKTFLAQERNVPQTCTLGDLSQEAADKAGRFEEINQALKRLEGRLHDVAVSLGANAESEVEP